VVKTILALCSSFDVVCVVEGVETQAQKDLLLQLGCRNMQGYFFHRPSEIADFHLSEH
jgi:EAL domain-containing protein (putative c-di-GMP-specific phosphodiesterase class I)